MRVVKSKWIVNVSSSLLPAINFNTKGISRMLRLGNPTNEIKATLHKAVYSVHWITC